MYKQIILVVCVLIINVLGNEPQVYENVDDQIQVESNVRVVRDPFFQPKSKHHQPQVYGFQLAQQDQRRSRYYQQQRSDMQNILKKRLGANEEAPLRLSLVQNWKVFGPSAVPSTVEQNYQHPEGKNNTSPWEKILDISTTKKPVTSRKLNPSSYFEDPNEKSKVRRADYDFNALNALVGQDPKNQLEGLQRLLVSPQTQFVLPPVAAPLSQTKPIQEHTVDIANPNTHPNIDTSNLSIEDLESQLDEAAKAQLAKALADAQKQALAEVEAQHRAIAKAQEEAQKSALAQIALHNQGIKHNRLPQPLALALRQEVVPVNLYAPTHGHNIGNEQLDKARIQANLKKISITKTHSVTQEHKSPNAYQEVVLENQQKRQTLYPVVGQLKTAEANLDKHHQYAARYAFGYKIRDVKMGNEFGHEEKRDGENAKGLYHVLLPDGRMQKVEYYADPSGYHAKVTYENLAHH